MGNLRNLWLMQHGTDHFCRTGTGSAVSCPLTKKGGGIMHAYKFETTILDKGVIQIPEMAGLAHARVEVFIVIKEAKSVKTQKSQTIQEFLEKWTGFLEGVNPDDAKLQYLQDKYK
jgi:hypothetical protein